jgi:hypothetical protein
MPIRTPLILLALLAPLPAFAAGDLLATSDQNPLLRGAYLPLPPPAGEPAQGWGLAAGLQWTNTVNIESTPAEQLLVDEESAELDLRLTDAVGAWHFRATLPVINRSAGILDSVINDFHTALHLPQGGRPLRPINAYAIEYRSAAGVNVDVPSGTALGDLALEAGRVLLERDGSRLAAWGGVEAPTGERARLTGDGALDAALWLEGGTDLGPSFSLDGRAGISRIGGSSPLPYARSVRFATLAFGWRATERLAAIVQLDAHSGAVRGTTLEFLGHAVLLTVGGRCRLASGSVIEAGVVEDVEVDHSPDVSFHVGWRWPVGGGAR